MKNRYKNKNVLVYGLSVSGIWVSKLLTKLKAKIFLFDDDASKLSNVGLKNSEILNQVDENIISKMELLIVSPSIEKDNRIIKLALKHNIKISSEVEFASQFCKEIVAVTGTNGKTTTVELITAILSTKCKAVACGNNGYPLSKAVLKNKKAFKVVEISSFMLENAQNFNPHIATILNIEPDHLIRHKTMEEYRNLKLSIFKNLKSSDYAVVNADLQIKPNTNCKQITYSYTHNADVRVKDGAIYLFNTKLINLNELKLKGKHNIYNAMCAICYAHILNVKPANICKALTAFVPNRFRNEHIATVNGISFINDSKSTNIASTIASVKATKGPVVLFLGGSNKQLNYEELFSSLSKRVKLIVAFGEISKEISSANNQQFNLYCFENLNLAFDCATSHAMQGDTLLFSPSSASYDQFSNYIERGQKFNELVKAYELENKKK